MKPEYAQRTPPRCTGRHRCAHSGSIHRTSTRGSAADLAAVVDHYNKVLRLGLKDRQKADLVEYLKTL
jgi:hypothetical protein